MIAESARSFPSSSDPWRCIAAPWNQACLGFWIGAWPRSCKSSCLNTYSIVSSSCHEETPQSKALFCLLYQRFAPILVFVLPHPSGFHHFLQISPTRAKREPQDFHLVSSFPRSPSVRTLASFEAGPVPARRHPLETGRIGSKDPDISQEADRLGADSGRVNSEISALHVNGLPPLGLPCQSMEETGAAPQSDFVMQIAAVSAENYKHQTQPRSGWSHWIP